MSEKGRGDLIGNCVWTVYVNPSDPELACKSSKTHGPEHNQMEGGHVTGPSWPHLLENDLWGEAYLSRAVRVNTGVGRGQAARSTPCLLISYLSPALLLMPFGLNVVNEI